jgi:hypothetical protein
MVCNCNKGLNKELYRIDNLDTENKILSVEFIKEHSLEEITYLYQMGYILEENTQIPLQMDMLDIETLACPTSSICPTGTYNPGQTASISFCASGGTAPYTWTLTKNNKTLSSATGIASDTPVTYGDKLATTDSGTVTYVATITDSCAAGKQTCSQTCAITVGTPCTKPTCVMTVNVA